MTRTTLSVFLLALFALSASSTLLRPHVEASELKLLWSTWKSLHHKVYAESEEIHRFGIFVQNYVKVLTHNNENSDVKLALNQFADLTEDEFRAQFASGIGHGRIVPQQESHIDYSVLSIPASVDWRTKGAVTPVKDQKACGSCWSFSTTGALEGWNFIRSGKLLSFSEQQFVDCEEDNWGCSGGWMHNALAYAAQNGVEIEEDYPYKGIDDECHFDASKAHKVSGGVRNVTFNDAGALKAAIAAQPVAVVIGVDGIMQHYKSGVVHKCTAATQHGVLVVGYGTVLGEEAYIVKNSWDTTWGDKGYFYLSTDPKPNNGQGVCGVLQLPSIPTTA